MGATEQVHCFVNFCVNGFPCPSLPPRSAHLYKCESLVRIYVNPAPSTELFLLELFDTFAVVTKLTGVMLLLWGNHCTIGGQWGFQKWAKEDAYFSVKTTLGKSK